MLDEEYKCLHFFKITLFLSNQIPHHTLLFADFPKSEFCFEGLARRNILAY